MEQMWREKETIDADTRGDDGVRHELAMNESVTRQIHIINTP